MLKPPTFAALCMALVSAAPASAEGAGEQDQRGSRPNVRLQIIPQSASSDPAGPRRVPEAHLFSGARPGLGLSSRSYRQEDGSSAVTRGLIGSLPVLPGVSAGLGLFSVTHEDQKEPEFRRNWNAKNIGPRNRKVAAVGMSVRF